MDKPPCTLDASAVRPAEFSLVYRPLCGPGLGFSPFAKASKILRVVSGVRSSYKRQAHQHSHSTGSRGKSGLRKTNVEVIVHREHRCVAARPEALHFNQCELGVLGRRADVDVPEVLLTGLEDLVASHEHARGGRADLDEVGADRFPRRRHRAGISILHTISARFVADLLNIV